MHKKTLTGVHEIASPVGVMTFVGSGRKLAGQDPLKACCINENSNLITFVMMNFFLKITEDLGHSTICDHLKIRRINPMATLLLFTLFVPSALWAENPDVALLRILNSQRDPSLDNFYTAVTDSAPWVAFTLPALLMIYFYFRRNKRKSTGALAALVSVGVAALASTILKFWIDRPRPFITHEFVEKLSTGGSPSFPSGHTTDAFAVAVVITLLARRWWIAMPAFFWAALVGYSRIHLGVHYPSDVVAGALIGTLLSGLTFKVLVRQIFKAQKLSSSQH